MKNRHEDELKDAGVKVAGSAITQIGSAIVGWVVGWFRGRNTKAPRGKTVSESRAAANKRRKAKRGS